MRFSCRSAVVRAVSCGVATLAFMSAGAGGDAVDLTNAEVPPGDGKLEIRTGDYGEWMIGNQGGADWNDFFDPGPVDGVWAQERFSDFATLCRSETR